MDASLGSVKQTVAGIENTVRGNSRRLDEQAASIRANCDSIAAMRGEIDRMKATGAPRLQDSVQTDPRPVRDNSDKNEADFRRARRSVRLWPVLGNSKEELWSAAGIFLGTNLGMTGKIDKDSIEAITRVTIPSGPGVRDEALVVFADSRTRDMVMGAAAKLAPFTDTEGRPTAGMRIEVPPFLTREFRILFKFGQLLRTRHGPGTRRHVKFDDVESNLYLNAKLPNEPTWSRIPVEVAMRGLRAREARTSEALERRLDAAGSPTERQRSSSMSAAPMDTAGPAGASAWTTRRTESTST